MVPTPERTQMPLPRQTRVRRSVLSLATLVALGCSLDGPLQGGRTDIGDGRPILFVGNSLTYWNDLPLLVQALADSAGEKLGVGWVAFGDFNLEDHDRGGAARRAIQERPWSVVVLQQGPSSVEENRQQLIASTKAFDALAKAAGARSGLYAVWPQSNRRQDFARAHESYSMAAAEVGGLLFPVGEAWRAAWRLDPEMPLYSADGLHPTPLGSYLAALVMVQQLTGKSPIGLPSRVLLQNGATYEVPAEAAAIAQRAAAEANAALGPEKARRAGAAP